MWGVEAVDPSFGRSDVNRRPLTDGWQTYISVTLLSVLRPMTDYCTVGANRFVLMGRARTHWANFYLFCQKICHQFPETSASGDFYIYQILSRLKTPSSCLGTGQILSGIKFDRFVNLHATI